MQILRTAMIAVLSLMIVDPAMAQRRAPEAPDDSKKRRRRRAPDAPDHGWKVRKAPVVSSFTPAAGPPRSVVVIRGRHFGPAVRVRFNGRWLRIVSRSRGQLQVKVPRRSVTDNFVINKPGFADVTSAAQFQVIRRAKIKRFFPPRGDAGITVEIRGKNFLTTDQIFVGNLPMRITAVGPRRITAVVPRGAISGPISIKRSGAVAAVSRRIFIISLPQPVIAAFAPTRGAPGTVVRITGSNFDTTDTVKLGGRALAVRSRAPSHIDVVIGANRAGPFVIMGRGGRRAVSRGTFSVIRPPKVKRFRPAFGPAGTRIVIFGAGFLPGDQPYLGAAMLTVRTISDRQIVAELPNGAASGRISVRRGPAAYFARRGAFNVISTPQITSISPPAAPPGSLVTVHGSNFMPKPSVLLAGIRLRIVRRGPNSLTVRIPANGRTGRIVVVTRGGSAHSPANFVLNRYAGITSLFPLRGLPGTRVKITGNDFHPGMRIFLGRVELPVTRLLRNSCVVVIPPGVPSGRMTMESHGRRTVSRMAFTVEQPRPEVAFTFSPQTARRGNEVTLQLTPGRQSVTVFFNGRPLPKKVLAGGRTLVVTVPGDARSGYFELEYNGRRYRADRVLRVR